MKSALNCGTVLSFFPSIKDGPVIRKATREALKGVFRKNVEDLTSCSFQCHANTSISFI